MIQLYKKDSKGEILIWGAEVVQNTSGVCILITHGNFEGNLTTNIRDNIKGKNIGKANETSPYTQAQADNQSLYNKKKREGYKSLDDLKYDYMSNGFEDIQILQFLKANLKFDTTDADGNVKPMKAQQYYRSKKNFVDDTGKLWDDRKYYFLLNPQAYKTSKDIIIKFPCLIQPKLNGVRATISLDEFGKVQILSKEGLRYNIPHIEDLFELNKECFTFTNFESGEVTDIVFDGELYIHNEKLQVITSAVKKFNFNTPRVEFIAFDLAIPVLTNIQRIQLLKQLLHFSTLTLEPTISYITTHKVGNDGFVQKYTDEYIKQGYEGSIMRNPNGLYAFGKRPMDMVKLKRVIDEEFTIVDIVPQDKNPSLGLYVCVTKEGREFKVTPRGDEDFKELLLLQKHLYLNKQLTCTFYEYTEDLIPFHVIDNLIRDYE